MLNALLQSNIFSHSAMPKYWMINDRNQGGVGNAPNKSGLAYSIRPAASSVPSPRPRRGRQSFRNHKTLLKSRALKRGSAVRRDMSIAKSISQLAKLR